MTLNNVMVQRGSSLGRRVDSLAQMPDSARLDLAAGLTRSRSPKMGSMWLDLSNSQAYTSLLHCHISSHTVVALNMGCFSRREWMRDRKSGEAYHFHISSHTGCRCWSEQRGGHLIVARPLTLLHHIHQYLPCSTVTPSPRVGG